MKSIFPYLSLKNIQRIFSRQPLELMKSSDGPSVGESLDTKISLRLKHADPEILSGYAALAAKCVGSSAVFFCTPQGDICWQKSDLPMSLEPLRKDLLVHLGNSAGPEVAVASRRAGAETPSKQAEVRVCAIAPLRTRKGELIGGLCAADERERVFEPGEKRQLQTLASELVEKLELQETARQYILCHDASQKLNRFILENKEPGWLGQYLIRLGETVHAEYAFIAERLPDRPEMSRTLCASFQGGILENFDYPLAHSPLEHLPTGAVCSFSNSVVKSFADPTLVHFGVEGFAAVCIGDDAGKPIRWIVVMDRKLLPMTAVAEAVLAATASPVCARLDHDRLKEALEREQRAHRGTIAAAMEGLYRMDGAGRYLSINPSLAQLMGYDSPQAMMAEVDGASGKLYADPERRKRLIHQLKSQDALAEDRCQVLRKNGGRAWISEKIRAVRGPDGKIIHYEGCIQDVTAQVLAEESFRASETRFQALFEHAAAGFALADRQGLITKVNPAFERLLGLSEDAIKHKSLSDFKAPDDAGAPLKFAAERVEAERDHLRSERRLISKDRGPIWTRVSAAAVRDGAGSLVSMIFMVEDLTPQKEAEDLFHARSVLFENLFEHAGLGLLISDKSGRIARANPAMESLLDAGEKDLKGKAIADLIHTEDREACTRQLSECVDGKRDRFQLEIRCQSRKHPTLVCRMTLLAVRAPDNAFQYWIAMFEDVTSRHETEKALLNCDEPIQSMLDDAGFGVAISDSDGCFKKVNKTLHAMLGYSEKGLLSKSLSDLVHAEDREKVTGPHQELSSGKRSHFQWEGRVTRKDHGMLWVRVSASAIKRSNGAPLSIIYMFEDITERKKADEALHQSHEQFGDMFDMPGLPLTFLDPKGAITKANSALQKLLHYSSDELKCKSLADLSHPDDRERCEKLLTEFAKGGRAEFEMDGRLVRKGGNPVWTHMIVSRLHGHNGTPPGLIGVFEDITPQKESEEALLDSQVHYRNLFEEAAFGSALLDLTGRVLETNGTLEELLGRSKSDLKGKPIGEWIHPEDVAAYASMQSECLEGKRDRFQHELKFLRPGSEAVWVRLKGSLVRHKDQSPEAVLLMLEGLTALKEAEARIRELDKKLAETEQQLQITETNLQYDQAHFHTLFDGAGVGVALVDRDQRFIEANPELQRMLGFTNDEFKTRTLTEVSHPDDTKMTDKFYQQCLDGKITHFQQEKCLRDKDMKLVWTRLTASSLCNEDGSMQCMYITFEDVGKRRDAELALTAANSKLHLAEFQYQESETRFRDLMEEASVGIALLDAEGRLMQCNPPLQRMLGFSAEELASKTFTDLSRSDDPAQDNSIHHDCVEGKRDRYEIEKKFISRDEGDFWGRLSVSGVKEADGSFKYAVAFLEDITAEKDPNAPRRETFSIRLRSPEEGFLTTDNSGNVVLMNHVAERLLGVPHSDAFGKPLGQVMTIVSETRRHRRKSAVELEGAHEDDTFSMNELALKLPDGSERTLLQAVRPLLDLEANSMGMIMVFRDLEEIAKMEHELIDAGKIEPDGIMDWQIANEFEILLTNLNILLVPVLAELKADGDAATAQKASELTEALTQNLATLTGMSQKSLA